MSTPTKRFNVTAGRPYTKRDGTQKKQWINIGKGTQWDDGSISLELHSVPVGNWFDGKLNLFEQTDEDRPAARQASSADSFDDVPFN